MIAGIWTSARSLPLWVQIWVFGVLVPVNTATLWFWGAPYGPVIAALAVGGMIPNAVLMVVERGFSRAMSFSHLLCWPPLLLLLVWVLSVGAPTGPKGFLWLLLGVDAISLGFDLPDARRWLRGERAVAGRENPQSST